MTPAASAGALPYTWDSGFSLLTNRFVVYDGAKLVAWTFGIIALLFTVISLAQGEPEILLPLLGMFALALAGLALLGALIVLIIFRNRFQTRNTITADGVRVQSISRAARLFNRFAVVAGTAGLSAGTAGAGALAMSGEDVGITWIDLYRVNRHDDQLVLSLMNSWRVVLRLYCTPENYATVMAMVTDGAARGARQRQAHARTAGPSPYPRRRRVSAFVLLAGLLVVPTPFEVSPEPVAVAMIATLAAIWLPGIGRVAGLVGLGAVVWALIGLLAHGSEVRQMIPESALQGMAAPEWGKYSGWSTLDQGEWIRFCVAAVGLAGLGLTAILALAGRFRPRA
jgi:hypothetical protein